MCVDDVSMLSVLGQAQVLGSRQELLNHKPLVLLARPENASTKMAHSPETRDDALQATTLRVSAKRDKTISSSDSAGPPPNFFGRKGSNLRALLFGATVETAKAIKSPGKSVERRRNLSGSGFKDAKSDAWAELGRRFQVARDPATSASSDGVVLARAQSDRDMRGASNAPNSSTDALPWAASWAALRAASQP